MQNKAEHQAQQVWNLAELLARVDNDQDLLHDLLSVKKMQYQEAWELATREWAFLPTEGRQR